MKNGRKKKKKYSMKTNRLIEMQINSYYFSKQSAEIWNKTKIVPKLRKKNSRKDKKNAVNKNCNSTNR
jgi:hypothetical protein